MTAMIDAVKTYILTYTGLATNKPVWVDYMGAEPTQYAIVPLPGEQILEEYLDGSSLREFSFAFQSMESTADELERLANNGFFESFAAWLRSQSESNVLPTLNSGQTPFKIEATSWGYLFQQGESQTGVYQITCRLEYDQE